MNAKDEFSFFDNKKVLITGNTGFIGCWLSLVLNQLNTKLYGYSLSPSTKPSLFELLSLHRIVETSINDIRNYAQLEKDIQRIQPEIILHLAAQPFVRDSYTNPVDTYSTNVMGTVNVLDIARKTKSLKRVIVMTTDKCYENLELERGYKENDPLGGRDPYSNSKACTELVVSAYRQSFFNDAGIALATIRAGNVIGGGDWAKDRIIPDIVRSILANKKVLVRNPFAIRPWQHVLEPIFGIIKLASKLDNIDSDYCGEWNLGPLLQDTYNVSNILDSFFQFWPNNPGWEIDKNSNQPHEATLLNLDSSKAREKLGWNPIMSFNEMIKDTADWYHAHHNHEDMNSLTNKQINSYIEKYKLTHE